MKDKLLITGMYRSGTTLLQKLLNTAGLTIHYQKFFQLFLETKGNFYKTIGHPNDYYLLGTLFNKSYSNSKFTEYLDSISFAKNLSTQIDSISNSNTISGTKEIVCEEYIPYLLESSFKVLHVIRDPRDIITSANYGKGKTYVGDVRPTLFNIQNWRKSATYNIEFTGHKNYLPVRYEDLVTSPQTLLNEISSFLGIESTLFRTALAGGIKNESGEIWSSNSSHATTNSISSSSVSSYKNILPASVINYISATCSPEMKILGYNHEKIESPAEIITNFKEPYSINLPHISASYSSDKNNIDAEILRLSLFNNKTTDKALIEKMFIFETAYKKLSEAA